MLSSLRAWRAEPWPRSAGQRVPQDCRDTVDRSDALIGADQRGARGDRRIGSASSARRIWLGVVPSSESTLAFGAIVARSSPATTVASPTSPRPLCCAHRRSTPTRRGRSRSARCGSVRVARPLVTRRAADDTGSWPTTSRTVDASTRAPASAGRRAGDRSRATPDPSPRHV